MEGRGLHNNGLSEDTLSVLRSGGNNGNKLERIAEISANSPKPEFTSLYHLINEEMLLSCHKELDGSKAVGIDEVSKTEYEVKLEENIQNLVTRLYPGYHLLVIIEGCFDKISHEWLMEKLPTDKRILKEFMKCGYVYKRQMYPTEEGSPQGGLC